MGVIVRLQSGRYRLFLKGASEILTKRCTCHVIVSKNPNHSQHVNSEVETKITDDADNDLSRDMTLVAVTDIEDPLRPGVHEAVATCHHAGVTIKICTRDNILTACLIATQCGIHTAGGIIMEAPVFRALDDTECMEVVPRLQVLARSSPEDKKALVETLYASLVRSSVSSVAVTMALPSRPPT
jgi:Ca2+-transporting ATPase